MVMFVVAVIVVKESEARIGQDSELPCDMCDLESIPFWEYKRISPICGPCGQLFGFPYEYCCVCHKKFRLDCAKALNR